MTNLEPLRDYAREYVQSWLSSSDFLPFPELLQELEDFAERDAQRKYLEFLAERGQDLNLGYHE